MITLYTHCSNSTGSGSVFVESEKKMSSQVRRDRSRFNPQQTWVPRGSSTSISVVNEPTERRSESLHAGYTASRPIYLQSHHNSSGHSPYNQHQRSNVTAPPPPRNSA